MSRALVSWDSSDLTWTARNQPVRTTWAMARASIRSVLTGMVFVATRKRRVSTRTTGRPASAKPACSHCDIGPASRPTRLKGSSVAVSAAASAPGSLSAS